VSADTPTRATVPGDEPPAPQERQAAAPRRRRPTGLHGDDTRGAAEHAESQAKASGSTLFGRGLLYVVVAGLQLVTGAIASPVLAHVLDDPAQLGNLATAIALHQFLAALLLVGLDHAVVLRRAVDGHDRDVRVLAGSAMVVVSLLTVVVWATSLWWAPAFGLTDRPLVLLTVLWSVPAAGVMVSGGLLLAADRLRPYSVLGAMTAVGGQVLGLAVVLGHATSGRTSPAAEFAVGLVAADVAGLVVGFALTRPRLRGALSWRRLAPALALGVPLALDSVSAFVLNAGDRILLQRLAGAEAVGRYQIAYTLGYAAVMVIGLMSATWTPRFAAVADRVVRWQLIGATRDTILRLLAPVVLGIAFGAPVALRIVAPASFRPEALLPVVVLVVLSAYPVAAGSASGRMLVTDGRTRAFALCTAAAAVVNLGLNALTIPAYGIVGAATSTLLAYVVQCLLQRAVVGERAAFPRTPPRVLVQSAVVVALASASVLLPQGDLVDGARFVLALACLPWCVARLRQARAA